MKIHYQVDSYPSDSRAAAYGDGCFTTMLVQNGVVQLLDRHIKRLKKDLSRLELEGFNEASLLEAIHTALGSEQNAESFILKVLVSAGSGGRGYARNQNSELQVFISRHPYPSHYTQWQHAGITLGLSKIQIAKQAVLAGVKHLNRLEQVLIKQDLEHSISSSQQDVIVTDTDGMMVETSIANLFWRMGSQWFTPDLAYSGVSGVMCEWVLSQFKSTNTSVTVVRAKPDLLRQCDSVFICNGVMGMVPVNKLEWNGVVTELPESIQDTKQLSANGLSIG